MTIDIIDLTQEEYADLSGVQLAMVTAAQAKKNELLADAEKKKTEILFSLLEENVARSSFLEDRQEEIDLQAQQQIEVVKADLLYQLAYDTIASEGNESGPYRYPENPNYNLAYPQRFLAVRSYYMDVTDDPDARLQAYSMDTLARAYLGEYYQTLYELLASYC